MSEVSLIINGRKVKAKKEATILEVARSVGIDIPTLCHHEKLAPYGACRLCTVEIIRGQRSRLVASCVYPVENGLIVKTESEPVIKGRRMLLELLWARAPGIQALRNYGQEYGITGVQGALEYGVMIGIKPLETKFEIEPNFCILCGLCVRYCAEVKGKNTIGFIGRGTGREVVFFPEITRKECSRCQECFALCPTGILRSYYSLVEAYPSK